MNTKEYEEKLNKCLTACTRIRADNTDQLKKVMKQWKEQKAILSVDPNTDNYFNIEDLKEWLYAIARNNEDYLNCIDDIVNRLPGFVQYTKDKKEGLI